MSNIPLSCQATQSCAYCGKRGPAEMFEQFNESGSVACKAVNLCQLRQDGTDPAHLLGALIREMSSRGELHTLTTRELAELHYDLRGGAVADVLGGFSGAVSVHLASRADSGRAVEQTEADRRSRKRRRTAQHA